MGAYIRLMNKNEAAMTIYIFNNALYDYTTGTLETRPVGEWFLALSADIQCTIENMVNEQGYSFSEIEDFIKQYGADAYSEFIGRSE